MDIEKIRQFFRSDRYLMMTGVQIDAADEGYAACSMDIAEMHMNAGGAVQGGAIYTLADSAFAVACNAGFIDNGARKITVNQSASIHYFRPPKGRKLLATARRISGGHRTSVYEMKVKDDLGTDVCLMIGNGYTVEL